MTTGVIEKMKLFSRWWKSLLFGSVVIVFFLNIASRSHTVNVTLKNLTKSLKIHQHDITATYIHNISESPTSKNIAHPQHRITLNFQGRLGNQMFMFASLLGIAKANHLQPYIRESVEMLRYFKHTVPTYRGAFKRDYAFGEKQSCAFEEKAMKIGSNKDTILNGYFQSWKYFSSIQEELKRQLQFKDDILGKAHAHFISAIKKVPHVNPVYIGVHVRRGDMVSVKLFVDYGYISAGEDYLDKALTHMRNKFNNTVFVVASDDIQWCEQHIKGKDIAFLEKGKSPHIDMTALTFCNHTIMTTGSYGWWISYLTGGDTVYYGGYPRPNTRLDKLFDKAAYYPPHWVKIT